MADIIDLDAFRRRAELNLRTADQVRYQARRALQLHAIMVGLDNAQAEWDEAADLLRLAVRPAGRAVH